MRDKSLRDSLAVIFLHASPDKAIESYLSVPMYEKPLWQRLPQNFSQLLFHSDSTKYSLDDASMVMRILERNLDSDEYGGVFGFVRDFACQTLTQRDNMPMIKYEEVLKWRNTVHPLGTIPFISAFLADLDNKSHTHTTRNFAINPILATDNKRIKILLERGIADNHFHLKGSSPAFILSWIALMNRVTGRKKQFRFLENGVLSDSLDITQRSLLALTIQAAAIRLQLFEWLKNPDSEAFKSDELREILNATESEGILSKTKKIQNIITAYIQESGKNSDYAIVGNRESTFACIAGEYYFQYQMFKRIFAYTGIGKYADLFYAYLIIQIRFRSEMIQSNRQHGFSNFNSYDERKSLFLGDDKELKRQQIVIAANCLEHHHFKHVEARFAPSDNISSDVSTFDEILKEKYGKHINEQLHYVLHIPKNRENISKLLQSPISGDEYICCRDHNLRNKTAQVISNLIALRDACSSQANRIVGIDACANEIGARPEAFAADFRRAKLHQPERHGLLAGLTKMPMINITYHVGEDFLDVADGLRAVWEAVAFLQLGRLDRLGHAIVLGIDIQEWYSLREGRIYLTRQDLLDNLAWLIHYLGINGALSSKTHFILLQKCETLYNHIYRRNMPYEENENAFSLSDYINALELRGDLPCAYNGYKRNEIMQRDFRNISIKYPEALRDDYADSPLYETRRTNLQAIRIYYHYHFNPRVKRSGYESTEFNATQQYIDSAKEAQHLLCREIAAKGIAIEVNPSSNVLIGNFNRYDKHPIVYFYDKHILNSPDNPRLFVSINTDDQGVFDTSLENEYALMACGLEKLRNQSGGKIILPNDIYKWLDDIRLMGLDQRFC